MNGKQGAWVSSRVCLALLLLLGGCGRSSASSPDSGSDVRSCVLDADCNRLEVCDAGVCTELTATGGTGDIGAGGAAGTAGTAGTTVGGSAGNAGSGLGGTAGAAGGATSCMPGSRSCDGSSVRVCADDGTSRIETTCSLSQVCSNGDCHAIACVPGSSFCKDGQVMTCSDDGASSSVSKKCGAAQFCLEQDGGADCGDTVCTPGAGLCVNSVATPCKADGSGPEAGGQDCTTKNLICDAGKCSDPTCTPGQKLCQHDDVYLCVGGGADAVLFTSCNANEVCDPEQVACRNRICDPGKLGCDSSRVATCNELGTGWDQSGQDCAGSSQICLNGACQSPTCVANSSFCKDGNVYLCDSTGVSATLSQTCSSYYYHCAVYGTNSAYCAYNACTPGAAVCSGNVATKCNADGSGYDANGTDCGTDQLCSAGACHAKVCTPYSYFCKDGDVNYCQDGLSSYVLQDCGADARCVKGATNAASCVPYDCSPGLKACLGNQVGTCADDGTSLSTVKQDCNTTGQVCTNASACGDSAVDTLGAAEELQSLASDYFFGDVIDVESNRDLRLIEANMVLAATRDLRFVVYENVTGTFIARFDQGVKDVSNNGYASSGAMSYTLKAGRRYLIGVAVTGGGFVPYYDALPWQPDASLGRVAGSLATAYATSFYAGYTSSDRIYDLRITSQLP